MQKPVMVVCDTETVYARKLFQYLSLKEGDKYEIILLTDEELLKNYLESKKIDILVVADLINLEKLNMENVWTMVKLTTDKNMCSGDEVIYKYSERDGILNSIIKTFADCNYQLGGFKNTGKLKILGVYSPIKRVMQTSFSLALGQMLAKKHKTLYLNLESYSGFDALMNKMSRENVVDLMYHLVSNSNGFTYRLESIKETIGALDYVPPAKGFTELSKIGKEYWVKLLEAISEQTDYEYVIIDLSEFVMGLFDLLSMCNQIFTITDGSRISDAKMAQYQTLLREEECESVLEKTKKFQMPVFHSIPNEFDMLPISDLAQFIRSKIWDGEKFLE